ncbi:MAG: IS4 family transposase, partial [Candidatus Lokiarchaeota archaeon]|nr:IS4 family transposase [Candidatus Lokiarchaeota archaeon]
MDSNNQNWESQYEFQKKYSSIECFFSKFHIGTILNNCGIRKLKGASPLTIMTSIFSLAFTGKNFFRGIVKNDEKPFGKDAAYEFLKSPVYNWRKVILMLGFQIFSFMNKLTGESRENVLIFDETPMDKSRSKKVELLAKVYDHAQNKFIKGFRMLTVCWSDGSSLIPLDFAILSSRNKKNRIQGIEKKLDKRTCGYKRR